MNAAGGRPYDPRYANSVLGILAAMALMVTYVETMVLPAISNFESFFGVYNLGTIAWILSAYLLVGVVVVPIFGKLGDLYGKKKILLIAMGVYAVAVSLAGFTPNIGDLFGIARSNQIYLLISVRALQGIGMGMFPLGFAMLPEVFPPAKVGQAQGIISGMFAGGAALGLVGGGWIAENYGWQLTYHTVIPIAILVLILAALFIRESPLYPNRKLDIPGVTSLGIGLTFLMLGITEGQYWGWTSFAGSSVGGVSLGVPQFFILALVAFVFFVVWERRTPSPVVSFEALQERNIWVSNLNGMLVGMTMFLLFTVLIILGEYPSPGFHLSELDAGLLFIPAVFGMMFGGIFLGRATARFGPKPVMMLGFGMITLGALGLALVTPSVYEVALFAIPIMAGNVGVLISMSNIIVLSVDPKTVGVHTGMNQTFRNLGSALGPVLVSSILAAYSYWIFAPSPVAPHAPVPVFLNYHLAAYQAVFALVAGVGLVGAVFSTALRNYRFHADGTKVNESDSTSASPGRALGPRPTTEASQAAGPAAR